jgi:hypothetical protein
LKKLSLGLHFEKSKNATCVILSLKRNLKVGFFTVQLTNKNKWCLTISRSTFKVRLVLLLDLLILFKDWVSYLGFSWCLKQQTSIVFALRVTNGPVLRSTMLPWVKTCCEASIRRRLRSNSSRWSGWTLVFLLAVFWLPSPRLASSSWLREPRFVPLYPVGYRLVTTVVWASVYGVCNGH